MFLYVRVHLLARRNLRLESNLRYRSLFYAARANDILSRPIVFIKNSRRYPNFIRIIQRKREKIPINLFRFVTIKLRNSIAR